MEGGALPVDGLLESGTSVEVKNDGEESDGAYGKGVGSVWCFGDAGDGGEMGSGWPGCSRGFDGSVEVGKVAKPLSREALELDEAPAVSAGAGFVRFG